MTETNGIDIKKLITVPAIITAVVTIVRLLAEFGNLPAYRNDLEFQAELGLGLYRALS